MCENELSGKGERERRKERGNGQQWNVRTNNNSQQDCRKIWKGTRTIWRQAEVIQMMLSLTCILRFRFFDCTPFNIVVVWIMASCSLVGGYQCCGGIYCSHLHFFPDDGGRTFFRILTVVET
jgi:hypothetical protein